MTGFTSGYGGAIYELSYSALSTDTVTFSGNLADKGAFYLSPNPSMTQAQYDTLVATHNSNILNTTSLSAPFIISTQYSDYAYNNYDIDLNSGAQGNTITINYYRESISPANLLHTETLTKVSPFATREKAIISNPNMGVDWLSKYQPSDCNAALLPSGLSTLIGNIPVTIDVIYQPKEKYTLTFESNGGSPVAAIDNIIDGGRVNAPTEPTKNGYIFAGWYKEIGLTTSWNFDVDVVTSNVTLYAKWLKETLPKTLYSVTFNSNSGSPIGPLNDIEEGNAITSPQEPTKDGYVFAGWHKEPELLFTWNFDIDVVTDNITLHAKWTKDIPSPKILYTVTFNSNGGTHVASLYNIEKGKVITAPQKPTKNGYEFSGWYKEEALISIWDFNKDIVAGNITLHAKWSKQDLPKNWDSTRLYTLLMLLSGSGLLAFTSFYRRKNNF